MGNYIFNKYHPEEGMDAKALQEKWGDNRYVNRTGDSMSGSLQMTLSSGATEAIILKAGHKLIFDG